MSDKPAKTKAFRSYYSIPKSNISPNFKEKLGLCENQIINFLNKNRQRKKLCLRCGQGFPYLIKIGEKCIESGRD
ncbi:hypothetical protein AAZX31_04G082500 [Glycine max]